MAARRLLPRLYSSFSAMGLSEETILRRRSSLLMPSAGRLLQLSSCSSRVRSASSVSAQSSQSISEHTEHFLYHQLGMPKASCSTVQCISLLKQITEQASKH